MSKRKTTEQFISEAKKVHGSKYDYSLSNYIGAKRNIKIICFKHGVFEQRPDNHINGSKGCPKCVGKNKTTSDFIKESKEIHGDKYDYRLVEYIDSTTKVKIICTKHGVFEQTPQHHLRGCDCLKCRGYLKSTEEFIKEIKNIHGNKYDYSLVEYIDSTTKVKIICPIHGIFEQTPKNHRKGKGCKECTHNIKYTLTDFIRKSNQTHYKYQYNLVDYINIKTKVKIICPIHGVFEQIPDNHIRKSYGCPKCKESKGERKIRMLLEDKKIKYTTQKRFNDCKNINPLPFDFYLPTYNTCIEFDGIQHFKPVDIWGGEKEFKNIQKRDKIKNEYCKNNNIRLLRIRYNEDVNVKIIILYHQP